MIMRLSEREFMNKILLKLFEKCYSNPHGAIFKDTIELFSLTL